MTREQGGRLVRLITAACNAASRCGAHPEDSALWEADREAFRAALDAVFDLERAAEGAGSADAPGPTGQVDQLSERTDDDVVNMTTSPVSNMDMPAAGTTVPVSPIGDTRGPRSPRTPAAGGPSGPPAGAAS